MEEINTYNPRYSSLKKMKKSGKNAATILQDNRALILQLIYEKKDISRKQLAEITGLQLATITIIIKELLAKGLICESGRTDGGNGRTVQTFSMEKNLYVISIRMTAVYIKVAAYNTRMENVYVKKVFYSTDDTMAECTSIILSSIEQIEAQLDKRNIIGVAIGVEHRYRLIEDDYAVWDKKRQEYCQIGKLIHDKTHYHVFTNRSINYSTYRMNEVAAGITGLKYFHVLINISVSYELESAIIIDNEIIYGKNGRCGQIKDIRVGHDSDRTYQDTIAVPAVLNRATELIKDYPDSVIAQIEDLNIRDVIAGYDQRDPLCRKLFDEVCYHLGYCVAEQIKWMDPDVVIVGDEVPGSEDFQQNLRKYVAKFADERLAQRVFCIMKQRVTQNDPALTGAADFAFQRIIGEIGLDSCV